MKTKGMKTKFFATAILCACTFPLFFGGGGKVAVAEELVSEKYKLSDYRGEASFALYKDVDGYLYGAGTNANGQLGRGYLGTEKKLEPYEGKILDEKVLSFDTGKSGFALAITENGKLYGWGNNANGQLAKEIKTDTEKETENCYPIPFEIELPQGSTPLEVDAGAKHSLLLTKEGEVYAWGESFYGQLGLSLETEKKKLNVTTPTKISQEKFGNERVVQIATTDATSYALTQSGKVYAWGDSDYGQIGDGVADPNSSALPDLVNAPVQTLLSNIKKISAEGATALALTQDGQVFVWGNMQSGQGGLIEATKWSSVPLRIEKTYDITGTERVATITDILCGGSTNFLLSSDGDVYAFGTGGSGELGFDVATAEKFQNPYAQMPKITVPTKVVFYEPLSIEKITSEKLETYLDKTPVDMQAVKEVEIKTLLHSGGGRTFVKDADGNVWSWGAQSDGLVGSGNMASANVPVLATLFRDQDYDLTIKTKNYMIEPIVGLSVIYGCVAVFLVYTEIKRVKQARLQVRENHANKRK